MFEASSSGRFKSLICEVLRMKEISYFELFKTIQKVLEFTEKDSTRHGLSVCWLYLTALKEKKGRPDQETALFTLAAFLHDIGRYGARQRGEDDRAADVYGYYIYASFYGACHGRSFAFSDR